MASLSSHQKYAPTFATSLLTHQILHVIVLLPVTTLSISSHISSHVVRTKPLSFKTTESLVVKSLEPFKTSVCMNSSGSGTVSNVAVSDSTNTLQSCIALVQHSISNSKQVADLDYFNSVGICLSTLGKFSSFVTTKCFPTFCPYWHF